MGKTVCPFTFPEEERAMLPRSCSTLPACLCVALLPSVAWAGGATVFGTAEAIAYEEPRIEPNEIYDGATVYGTGEATVHAVPAKVRVEVQLAANGKTVELALQRLKVRREAVAETLRGLGAGKESIALGDPCVNEVANAPGYSSYSAANPYAAAPGYYSPPPSGPSLSPYQAAPPTVAPYSATPVAPASPPGARGDSSSSGPSGYQPSAPSPSSPPSTSPPSTYRPGATSGTGTTPSAASVPNSLPLNSPVPSSTPAYGYGSVSAPVYAPPPPAVPAETDIATGTLAGEWALGGANTTEQALLAGEAIRKKVLAADLKGDKARGDAADDKELPSATVTPVGAPQVQTAVAQNPYTGALWPPNAVPASASPAPVFSYVATISSQQRKAALAEAFGKAKSQAAEMAEATGGKLAAVDAVIGAISNSGRPHAAPLPVTPPDGNEAVAADPGEMQFHVKVSARFHLE